MDIIESNHGSLVWRKAKTNGIPKHYIKSYNDVLGVGEGWNWSFDLTLTLPNGQQCYVHHGKSSDVLKLSQQSGMNAVQGHFHERFKIDYWANSNYLVVSWVDIDYLSIDKPHLNSFLIVISCIYKNSYQSVS